MTILPALVAIAIAFLTRQVVFALFLGVMAGSAVLLLQGWMQDVDPGSINPIERFFFPKIGSEGFAQILLIYLWALGGLTGLWAKTGGARHFASVVGGKMAKGPRSSLFFSWLVGAIFHQGGTVSTVLAGTTVKPVTDRHGVSHEELSYVVDSTASPIATVLPFNAWPAYVGGLAVGTVPFLTFDTPGEALFAAQRFFVESILFNFYGVLAVLSTLLFAVGWMPIKFGRMRRAIERSRSTGALDAPDAEPLLVGDLETHQDPDYPPSLLDFFVPLGTLLGFAIVPYALEKAGVIEDGNWINEAFALAVLSAMGLAVVRGMRLRSVVEAFIDGCSRMTVGAIVLALAVTLGQVAVELNTATWVASAIGDAISPVALPAILTVLCMVTAFATGSSWGTFAVIVPVALPLAWSFAPDPTYVSICFGAVIGGSVFGDQCSPISDTTILSSMFTGCDLMDHVRSQLPYALLAAGVGAVASTVCAAAVV